MYIETIKPSFVRSFVFFCVKLPAVHFTSSLFTLAPFPLVIRHRRRATTFAFALPFPPSFSLNSPRAYSTSLYSRI